MTDISPRVDGDDGDAEADENQTLFQRELVEQVIREHLELSTPRTLEQQLLAYETPAGAHASPLEVSPLPPQDALDDTLSVSSGGEDVGAGGETRVAPVPLHAARVPEQHLQADLAPVPRAHLGDASAPARHQSTASQSGSSLASAHRQPVPEPLRSELHASSDALQLPDSASAPSPSPFSNAVSSLGSDAESSSEASPVLSNMMAAALQSVQAQAVLTATSTPTPPPPVPLPVPSLFPLVAALPPQAEPLAALHPPPPPLTAPPAPVSAPASQWPAPGTTAADTASLAALRRAMEPAPQHTAAAARPASAGAARHVEYAPDVLQREQSQRSGRAVPSGARRRPQSATAAAQAEVSLGAKQAAAMHEAHMRSVGWLGVDGGGSTHVNMFAQFTHTPGAPAARSPTGALHPWSHLDVYHRPTVPPTMRMYAAAREQAIARRMQAEGRARPTSASAPSRPVSALSQTSGARVPMGAAAASAARRPLSAAAYRSPAALSPVAGDPHRPASAAAQLSDLPDSAHPHAEHGFDQAEAVRRALGAPQSGGTAEAEAQLAAIRRSTSASARPQSALPASHTALAAVQAALTAGAGITVSPHDVEPHAAQLEALRRSARPVSARLAVGADAHSSALAAALTMSGGAPPPMTATMGPHAFAAAAAATAGAALAAGAEAPAPLPMDGTVGDLPVEAMAVALQPRSRPMASASVQNAKLASLQHHLANLLQSDSVRMHQTETKPRAAGRSTRPTSAMGSYAGTRSTDGSAAAAAAPPARPKVSHLIPSLPTPAPLPVALQRQVLSSAHRTFVNITYNNPLSGRGVPSAAAYAEPSRVHTAGSSGAAAVPPPPPPVASGAHAGGGGSAGSAAGGGGSGRVSAARVAQLQRAEAPHPVSRAPSFGERSVRFSSA